MRTLKLGFILVLISTAAFASLQFPKLTGWVIDNAHILSPSTIQSLDQSLAEYEQGTSNQVVVVTLPSLQGTSIEDYGYQLGRYWQIGQKDKNNGAILIVAPTEHKARIEVGYGLEPVLTDAASSAIVQGIVIPQFKAGHMEQGIIDGTQAMLSVLGGKSVPAQSSDAGQMSGLQILFLLIGIFLFFRFSMRHPFIAAWLLSNQTSRFGGSSLGGSGWGGGFSGGGGSFGGGGASGSW